MLIKTIQTEQLLTYVYDSRLAMGEAAGIYAAQVVRELLTRKEYVNVIFAAAPSQNEMLKAFLKADLDFSRIRAFHMDEYAGLDLADQSSFACYLYEHIFSKAPFASVNYIPAKMESEAACEAYSQLLKQYPPDVVCMGIGENGHIAFNDPHVADFKDSATIKKVELDYKCRMQQVHDGCFPTLEHVPKYALTLTVPTLLSAQAIVCTVPASTKADAVCAMLEGPYGEKCPATALRRHVNARMFLDCDSASKVMKE